MRRAIKSIFILLFLSALVLLILLVDLSPIVKADGNAQVNQADTIQPLIDQLRKSLRSRYQSQTISVSKEQAESLAGFTHRALNKANAEFLFSEDTLEIRMSYKLSALFSDVYFNVQVLLNEGENLDIRGVRIGKLSLPGDFALSAAEYLANRYTSSTVASIAIATVKQVTIAPSRVDVDIAPMDALLREFKNIETGGSSQDTRLLKIRVAHYLRLLDGMYVPPKDRNTSGPSFAYYLHAVMKEANVLSSQNAQSSATLENEAAIIALSIYAGSPRFATLIGDLSFAIDKIPFAIPRPVLVKRGDLSLHFIFSAVIKLLSEKGVSIAIGEFKELMDRGEGGSGFSFVDLAADMSGAHFAALAVDPKTALHVQSILSQYPSESLFMVAIDGLEEGMNKEQFVQKYQGVDSEEYKQVVNTIKQRIDELPINPANNTQQ